MALLPDDRRFHFDVGKGTEGKDHRGDVATLDLADGNGEMSALDVDGPVDAQQRTDML